MLPSSLPYVAVATRPTADAIAATGVSESVFLHVFLLLGRVRMAQVPIAELAALRRGFRVRAVRIRFKRGGDGVSQRTHRQSPVADAAQRAVVDAAQMTALTAQQPQRG